MSSPEREERRWTIYKRTGRWDDVIEGPNTINGHGGEVVIPEQRVDGLVEQLKREADSARVLRDRHGEPGDELWTQYDSAARTFDVAARIARAALKEKEKLDG